MALYATANRTTEESTFIVTIAFIVHRHTLYLSIWINTECLQKLTMLLIWDRLRKYPRKDWLFRLNISCQHFYWEVPIYVASLRSVLHCVFILDILECSSILAVVAVKVQLCKHQKLSEVALFQNKDLVERIEKIRNIWHFKHLNVQLVYRRNCWSIVKYRLICACVVPKESVKLQLSK